MTTSLKVLITWDIPEQYLKKLKKEFTEIEFVKKIDIKEIDDDIEDAHILFSGKLTESNINKAHALKWIQLHGHGVEKYLFPKVMEEEIILTNARQVHHIPMAEHAFALMLNYTRKVTELHDAQKRNEWAKMELYNDMRELYGKNLLLIGTGEIGTEIAKRAQAFKMLVKGLRKNAHKPHPEIEEIYGMKDLKNLLPEMDFIIVSLPLTEETTDLITKKELKQMKEDALLINIGRGGVINEQDLCSHLKECGRFHCALDVFQREPLQADSEFYDLPNVFVSPHISGISPHIIERQYHIFRDNLQRYLMGKPLKNLVKKNMGY